MKWTEAKLPLEGAKQIGINYLEEKLKKLMEYMQDT